MVARQRSGDVSAVSNVCRHRSAVMMQGAGHAAAIQCPYHLWTYDLAGGLVGAPEMRHTESFDPQSVFLPVFRCEIWQGSVMVNLHRDAPSLASLVPGLEELLAPHGLDSVVPVASFSTPAPWD